jgi:hypothetical protein
VVHAELMTPTGSAMWAGEIGADSYTWESAQTRAYGSTNLQIERDHPIIEQAAITSLRGTRVSFPHHLIGAWNGIQIGRAGHGAMRWDVQVHQVAALFKHLTVPNDPSVSYGNLPAGVIAQRALTLALADRPGIPLKPGSFAEAPPLIDSLTFQGQSLDSIYAQLMDTSGQEYRVSEYGVVDWIAPTGTLYETVLTEGYDFILLSYEESEDSPVGMVRLTDQRGWTETLTAPEHALDPTARVLTLRADTASTVETRTMAQGYLDAGRVVPTVYEIGLLPAGGTIAFPIPGPGITPGGGGTGFPLMGGGFPLMGGGFVLYGGSSGGSGDSGFEDLTGEYPTLSAPHWSAIREGTIVRLVAPSAGLLGEAPLCRVLSRTFGDALCYPVVKLVSIPPATAQTLSIAKDPRGSAVAPRTMERIVLRSFDSIGTPIDAARLSSQLAPIQVPAISSLNGTATATQVPALQDLTGALTPAQVPSGGTVADAAAAPTQAEFNALTAALRSAGVID